MRTTANLKGDVGDGTSGDENYTPAWLIEAVRDFFGGRIDTDPYSCEEAQRVVKAVRYGTKEAPLPPCEWLGKVWINPPYSKTLILEAAGGVYNAKWTASEIMVLTNIECATKWARSLLHGAEALCLLDHRIQFTLPGGGRRQSRNMRSQMLTYFGNRPGGFGLWASKHGLGTVWR